MKIKKTLSLLLTISLFLFFVNCTNNSEYSLKCSQSNNESWYYEIYFKDQLLIKQESIPSLKGFKPFKLKQDASKVGLLVIEKLKKGKAPTISSAELKKLNINIEE